MDRTYVAKLVALLLLVVGMAPAVAAQAAQTGNGLGDLGLPELNITITESTFEGIPEQVEAGRYIVSVSSEDGGEFGGGVGFVQPVGVSAEEFLAALSGPPPSAAEASPEGSPPADGGGMGGPPPFIYDATYAGGVATLDGEMSQVVLDLTPGEWFAWGDDPGAPQEPVIFEVTGEMPTDLPEPDSSATLVMGEYVIDVSKGELVAGPQVVRIDNVGAQPHFLDFEKGPDGVTEEQIAVVLDDINQSMMSGGEPEWTELNPEEDLEIILFTGSQSTGTSIWAPIEFEAGTHVLFCFFPDSSDGMPHADHGMYTVIEVGE